ncbi:hypothetical protein ACEPAF_7835 [Sanghuangporus sanghuang]
MPSRRRRRNIPVLAVVVALAMPIEMARADQLARCNDDTKWMENDSGESPCTVAHFLLQQCATPDSELAILPLNGSVTSYGNPLEGRWCTCNTVVYNLMSACAVCQDGLPTDFMTWTKGCAGVSHKYPEDTIARTHIIPRWAYVNVTKQGIFNRAAAEEATDENKGWSAMQIALPIIIGVAVALLAIILFYIYRRRLKRRYDPIGVTYPPRPTHTFQDSRSYSHQSIPQSVQPSHQQTASASSLGLHSLLGGRNSPDPTRKKSTATVAWERARMDAPRKFGGLLPDRRKVHERTRGADWSIDADPVDPVNEYNDPWHSKVGSSSSSGSGGSRELHSKEASGDTQRSKATTSPSHSSRTRPTGHERSESQLGLLSDGSPDQFQPIQDSPGMIRGRPANAFVQGIVNGLSGIGDAIRLGKRPRPMAVVSSPPRRGFKVDDVDSASPTVPRDPRGSRYESFVFVEAGDDIEAGPNTTVNATPSGTRTSFNLGVNEQVALSQNPSQSGSSGSGTRSDGIVDDQPSVSGNGNGNTAGDGKEERRRNSVLLISRSPGQDFNSTIVSPITDETAGFGTFSASSESENWPPAPALPDASIVSLPAFSFARRTASSNPPTPPPTSQTYRSTNSPSHSAPGTPHPPSRILIPQGNGNSQLIVPPAVRAAGGYTQPTQPAPSAALSPQPVTSTASLTSTAVLPNTRLFSGTIAESVVAEPPSAVSYASAAPATTPSAEGARYGSEHSSDAYTVPNPFIFDERRGGSVGAARALRIASPPRSRSRAEVIE